jgi:dihydroorotate dehydrogenase electron transfer subunit
LFELLDQEPDRSSLRVVTCGPEIMMQKVAEGCLTRQIDCQVSMETPMACGIGICFSCVAKVRGNEGEPWDFRRTCVEGPIFDAKQLEW